MRDGLSALNLCAHPLLTPEFPLRSLIAISRFVSGALTRDR